MSFKNESKINNITVISSKKDTAYRCLNELHSSFGRNIKVETHLHTPASYDYELFQDDTKRYNKLSDTDMLYIMLEEGIISQSQMNYFKTDLDSGKTIAEIINSNVYKSFKEYASYLLIVNRLVNYNIEVAIVCDHNTVDGIEKLKYARKLYSGATTQKINLDVFLGVEISCGDKTHLIGIFENDEIDNVRRYLNETINDLEGTYKTSLQVMQEIHDRFNALTYIAHLDTSSVLMGSGAYKKELFNNKLLTCIGLSDINKKDITYKRIYSLCNKDKKINFIVDGDSHNIDSIGKKNVWIKFGKINFKGLKKAFQNFNTCINNCEPKQINKYIKGVYIYTGKYGFLGEKPNKYQNEEEKEQKEAFYLKFSNDLNCIIGGRGTGKSTILKLLDMSFTLKSDTQEDVTLVSKHSLLYILFSYNNLDYLLEFNPQREFYENNMFFNSYKKELNTNHIKLNDIWNNVYLISKDDKGNFIYTLNSKDVLESFFRRSYSINRLINGIQNGTISRDIKDIVMNDVELSIDKELEKCLSICSKSYSFENINILLTKIDDSFNLRSEKVSNKIKRFNEINIKKIQITHEYSFENSEPILNDFYKDKIDDKNKNKSKYINNTIFSWEDAKNLMELQISKIGIVKYFKFLLNKDYNSLETLSSISSVKRDYTLEDFENEKRDIKNINDINEIYDEIKKNFYYNKKLFLNILGTLPYINDKFGILFNVENNEVSNTQKTKFEPLNKLSLGQQVSALLSFIIDFGEYINDDTPLIIDQPEDNLDNIYIYRNLVESLKNIKNKRQVIIATHNSTIVINSETEQVIVLESNNYNGWVRHSGYPTEKTIMKDIVNYLEGGESSLKHKLNTYSTILPDLFEEM